MILDNMGLTQSFTIMAYLDNGTVSDSDGEILVSLKPDHRPTADYVVRLRDELPKRFPGCTFYFMPADITSQILDFGLPAPIDVQVVGVDRPGGLAVAKKIQQEIAKLPGLADVHVQQITDRRDLQLDVDRTEAAELGLDPETDDAPTACWCRSARPARLVAQLLGQPAEPRELPRRRADARFQGGLHRGYGEHAEDHRFNPAVAAGSGDPATTAGPASAGTGATTSAVMNTPNGAIQLQPQLLSNLVNLRRTTSQQSINHYNVQPVYEVYANVQGRDLGTASVDVQKVIDAVRPNLPRGSTIALRGQVQSMNSSFTGLAGGLVFAVLLVYFLMVVNFQSWLDPFIILTALPGALAGIVWMLYVTQTTVSVPALMGAMMCVGVATSNSILLVTFANEQRHLAGAGHDARSAALTAGTTRLRPVIMTALAMIVGMAPMSLGLGEGGEQNAPLGRAVIGGLLAATAFTLFFVPVMYSLLRRAAPRPETDDPVATDPKPAANG